MASRKKPLSEQLADLLAPAPIAGHEDPEDAQGFGAEARALFSADASAEAEAAEGWGAAEAGVVRKGEGGAGRARGDRRPAAREKGLSMRGELVVEGREYGGSKSSRSALFGGWDDDVADDDDDVEGSDDDVDEGMENDSDAEQGMQHEGAGEEGTEEEEMGGSSEGSDGDEEEEAYNEDDFSEDEEARGEDSEGEREEERGVFAAARATMMDMGMDALDRDFEAALKDEFQPAFTVPRTDSTANNEDDADEDGDPRLGRDGAGAPVAIARHVYKGAVRDEDKGRAVAAQRVLWERALELRIALQRPLQSACRLPHPSEHSAYAAVAPDVAAEFQAVAAGTRTAIRRFLSLQDELFRRNPAVDGAFKAARAAMGGAEGGEEDGEEEEGGAEKKGRKAGLGGVLGLGLDLEGIETGSSEEVWEQVSRMYERFRPFSQSSIDRWHRKTLLTSGAMAASRSSSRLRALNQSVSQQVASALRAPDRLIQRSRLPRGVVSVIGARAGAAVGKKRKGLDGAAGEGGIGEEREGQEGREVIANGTLQGEHGEEKEQQGGPEEEKEEEKEKHEEEEEEEEEEGDPESYDDTEFYQQLLREFLDSSRLEEMGITGLQVARRLRGKKSKVVDRRASKGRKVRYVPMAPLVNFMAPEPVRLPPVVERLFGNLFGQVQGRK